MKKIELGQVREGYSPHFLSSLESKRVDKAIYGGTRLS